MQRILNSAEQTEQFGAELGLLLPVPGILFLYGNLGAGKTTLVRGLLHGAGYAGAVKSPTYTLVEEYELAGRKIVHFDLYRLADPEELEWMGIRDYFNQQTICIFEWPERGEGVLPVADVEVYLTQHGAGRRAQLEWPGKVSST